MMFDHKGEMVKHQNYRNFSKNTNYEIDKQEGPKLKLGII